tara:strand:- start:2606 stop:2740 length:135 start_codon:yes stop_codon:yes gene_type:complete
MIPTRKDAESLVETMDPNLAMAVTGLYALYTVMALWNHWDPCTC